MFKNEGKSINCKLLPLEYDKPVYSSINYDNKFEESIAIDEQKLQFLNKTHILLLLSLIKIGNQMRNFYLSFNFNMNE